MDKTAFVEKLRIYLDGKLDEMYEDIDSLANTQQDSEPPDPGVPAFTAAEVISHIEDVLANMPNPDFSDPDYLSVRNGCARHALLRFKQVALARLTGKLPDRQVVPAPTGTLSDADRKKLIELLRVIEDDTSKVSPGHSHTKAFNAIVDAFSILKAPDRIGKTAEDFKAKFFPAPPATVVKDHELEPGPGSAALYGNTWVTFDEFIAQLKASMPGVRIYAVDRSKAEPYPRDFASTY